MATIEEKKYSKVLLEVAREKEVLDELLNEVDELSRGINATQAMNFFANPSYSDSSKEAIVEALKAPASNLMKNFLNTLYQNGRMAELEVILTEVKNTANDTFKVSDVDVISAVPLTEEQIKRIIRLAKIKFDLNEVRLDNIVDDRVLGGFIMMSRGKIIDTSLRTQLAQLAKKMN